MVSGMTDAEFSDLLHDQTTNEQLKIDDEGDTHTREGEDISLLSSVAKEGITTTGHVAISADPFVETLMNLHHEEADVAVIDTIGTTDKTSDADNDVVTSREAFLLSVPMEQQQADQRDDDDINNTTTSFILALPETTLAEKEVRRERSDTLTEAVSEFAHDVVENMLELPTDVTHVGLELHLEAVETKSGEKEEEVHLDVVVDRQV